MASSHSLGIRRVYDRKGRDLIKGGTANEGHKQCHSPSIACFPDGIASRRDDAEFPKSYADRLDNQPYS